MARRTLCALCGARLARRIQGGVGAHLDLPEPVGGWSKLRREPGGVPAACLPDLGLGACGAQRVSAVCWACTACAQAGGHGQLDHDLAGSRLDGGLGACRPQQGSAGRHGSRKCLGQGPSRVLRAQA